MHWQTRLLFTTLVVLTSLSCASQDIARHALSEQILKPRVGFRGLTNRACDLLDKDQKCKPENRTIKEYLFEDEDFRKTANSLSFVCKVAGKRYKICIDKPGLCRISYIKRGSFLKSWKEKKEEYIPALRYQFLLDAGTVCFSENKYDFLEVE